MTQYQQAPFSVDDDKTAANAHGITETERVLHGEEKGFGVIPATPAWRIRKMLKNRGFEWNIAMKLNNQRAPPGQDAVQKLEKIKTQIREKVEHPFLH